MGLKSFAAKQLAKQIVKNNEKWSQRPEKTQELSFKELIAKAKKTAFGKDHGFNKIKTYKDFQKAVPVRNYEAIKPYIEKIKDGESDVLWPGRPKYFAKTSGTTSGAKFIPLTDESIPNHLNAARDTLLHYIYHSKNAKFTGGKMMFLSGSPELDKHNGVLTGRLSGIVNHHVPSYLQQNKVPTHKTNCIEDWDEKVKAISKETRNKDLRLVSGIPPWIITYFDQLVEDTGKKVGDLFPNLQVLVHGGVNFQPYHSQLENRIGRKIDYLETFPASEGFFAFQDNLNEDAMLLLLNSGMFFEFIPQEEIGKSNPERLTISEVETGMPYSLIISSNAGLWAYEIGDLITFVKKKPYKIKVSGRVSHYISAFGEHVIGEEVDRAMIEALRSHPETSVSEFTVAPLVETNDKKPRHEWFIEFEEEPDQLQSFAQSLDEALQKQNPYYKDLISGKILEKAAIKNLKKGAFKTYMESMGRLGGQNKPARLSNDRKIVDELEKFMISS